MDLGFDFTKIEGFDWNKGNLDHIKKHNVGYKECEEIFFNTPLRIDKNKKHSQLEERFEALGQTNSGRLLFVVFTIRANKFRIISARDQNRKEKIQRMEVNYEKI